MNIIRPIRRYIARRKLQLVLEDIDSTVEDIEWADQDHQIGMVRALRTYMESLCVEAERLSNLVIELS